MNKYSILIKIQSYPLCNQINNINAKLTQNVKIGQFLKILVLFQILFVYFFVNINLKLWISEAMSD